MPQGEAGQFTVGVFQDVAWATRGIDALASKNFPPAVLTVVAKDGPEAAALIEKTCGAAPERLDLPETGAVLARGGLIAALRQAPNLTSSGLGAALTTVGFQPHDGKIYERLVARGGVLVAVESQSRAADALAVLHSYGGGNAAIGAWSGRL